MASKWKTHENYTTNSEKGTRQQYSGLGTEMYPPTKNRTRKNGEKLRPVRTGTLQPAECRYRQIISLGKLAAQCYGGNVFADPLCSEALLRTVRPYPFIPSDPESVSEPFIFRGTTFSIFFFWLYLFIHSFENYITNRYKESLKREGRADQLADIDIISALDMLCSHGQYAKCLEMAKPHGDQVLHKYVALYATQLIKVSIQGLRKMDNTVYVTVSQENGLVTPVAQIPRNRLSEPLVSQDREPVASVRSQKIDL